MPTISVIVPVYNAEKCLHRCVDSILSQTFTDFELLLIDDGSKDKSGAICDEYVLTDFRVHAFHKENGGVSSARNLGLDNIAGEWITFVDSDDWVEKEYIRNLLQEVDARIDMVMSYPRIIKRGTSLKEETYPSRLVTNENFEKALIENFLHGSTSPWGKLFRRSLIEKIGLRFCENMHIGEDTLFFFTYLLHISQLYISNRLDYNYSYDVPDSLTKRVYSIDSELMGYKNITRVIDELIRCKNVQDSRALKGLNWMRGYYERRILNALYHNKSSFKERLSIIKSLNYSHYMSSVEINSFKEEILAFLLRRKCIVIYDFIRVLSNYIKRC